MHPRMSWPCRASIAALLALAVSPAFGQAASAAKRSAAVRTVPLRTVNGQPNLEGYWTNATFTPLERPVELGTKEFYSEAEAVAFEKQRIQRENSQSPTDIHYDNVAWQSEHYSKGNLNLRTSVIFDPPDGRVPPLSEAGKKHEVLVKQAAARRQASESASSRSLAERCISWGAEGPPMLGTTYNANLQIVQTASSVSIYNEMVHHVRTIPLDGTPHLPSTIRQLSGDSRGHWEGQTLVVDTINFTDETPFRGPPAIARQDIFSSRDMHVIERFTRTGPDTIQYRFTVDDPGTWTKPWTGELNMRRFEGPILEYACQEGNYGLANILAAARAAEEKKSR